MQELTEERWQEIRTRKTNSHELRQCLDDVINHYDHLHAQIAMLAAYIMSERPDDPAWKSGEGACAMAVEIMKREAKEIDQLWKHGEVL